MNCKKMLKHLALVLAGAMILPAFATADIKMGVILGFTGPIESLTPDMGGSAEVAFKEASDSGLLLGGQKIVSVRADSTCLDAGAAPAAAAAISFCAEPASALAFALASWASWASDIAPQCQICLL